MRKLILTLVGVLALASNAAATGWWHTSTVQSVYPAADGRFVLVFTSPHVKCTNPDGYFTVSPGENGASEAGVKNMYAAALAGAATGNPVSVFFEDATPSCFVNRLSVNFN